METPTRTGPPYLPVRRSRWVSYRTPRWLYLAGLLVLAGAVAVGLAVHPSRSQRAADMNGFLRDMTADIQSCSGGVRESLQAMRAIRSGTEHDRGTAVHIATYGATNCSPANNTQLEDLAQYQVHESLARFRLGRAVDGLVTWAFPYAQNVQTDVARLLRASGPAGAGATAKLHRDLQVLDAQRARVDQILRTAATATGATAPLPPLAG
jgi:hypothetical protein